MAAPDRTDNNKGFSGDPNSDFISSCTASIEWTISSHNGFGKALFHDASLQYRSQHSVVIVNPGGTDSPKSDISLRFAPFPPKTRFASLPKLESGAPFPKGAIGVYSNPSSAPTWAAAVFVLVFAVEVSVVAVNNAVLVLVLVLVLAVAVAVAVVVNW